MVNCAVYACTNRTKRAPNDENFVTVGFFAIPKLVTGQCAKTAALSAARRAEWFRRIRRDDIDESSTHYRVCGVHFISGRAAYVMDDMNPDWAPNLKHGYGDRAADRTASDRRYFYHENRRRPLVVSHFCSLAWMPGRRAHSSRPRTWPLQVHCSWRLPSLHWRTAAAPRVGPGRSHGTASLLKWNSSVQLCNYNYTNLNNIKEMQDFGQTTDITLQSLALLEDENRQLMSDLRDARAKLAAHCLDEDAFHENEDMVPFYTGLPNFANLLAVFQLIQSQVSHNDRNCLTKCQEMIVFLIRVRLNTPLQDLVYRYGCF
ncbi:unnamed protein product [Ixodes persulcatus]